jgi:uncharacterized glyoxalase superfamily protein PhnB
MRPIALVTRTLSRAVRMTCADCPQPAAPAVRRAANRAGFEKRDAGAAPYRDVMTSIDSVTLEVADTAAAADFYSAAFGLGSQLRFRASDAPTSGFRGFTLSLVTSQPANVDALFAAAVASGATIVTPVAKSMWGYGGIIQAPDGALWNLATSAKKDRGPASRQFDFMVLLLAAEDVGASKKFYQERGLETGKSFGSYVEFNLTQGPRQVRQRRPSRHRLAPDRDQRRRGSLHRPGRLRLGAVRLTRPRLLN